MKRQNGLFSGERRKYTGEHQNPEVGAGSKFRRGGCACHNTMCGGHGRIRPAFFAAGHNHAFAMLISGGPYLLVGGLFLASQRKSKDSGI